MRKMKKGLGILLAMSLMLPPMMPAMVSYADQNEMVVEEGRDDKLIIPDKYNTGCKGKLIDYASLSADEKKAATPGVEILYGTEDKNGDGEKDGSRIKVIACDQDVEEYVIRDIDFSEQQFYYNEYKLPEGKEYQFRFENCRFKLFRGSKRIKTILNHCSFESTSADNSVYNYCQFGHSYSDGIRAFNDVTFNNCYIVDMQYPYYNPDPKAAQHIDGTQLFGNNHGDDVKTGPDSANLHFYNCRYEIPTYYIDGDNKATMNDCIMIQNEYSNAHDISFENIITNGAAYQVSLHRGMEKKYDKDTKELLWEMHRDFWNISMKNCRMGEGSIYGPMTAIDPDVELENVRLSTDLYIGSSWKDEKGKTHFSVTNDSINERVLTIVTDKETKSVKIAPYLDPNVTNKKTEENKYKYKFEDYPIDIDVAVDADKYAVCYDTTYAPKQIRFVNYTENQVIIDKSELDKYTTPIKVVSSGKCSGDKYEVYYELTSDGVLRIFGKGEMMDFHSGKLPMWERANPEDDKTPANPKPYICKVIVEEGVTRIGNQAFNKRNTIQEVELPSTLESIGSLAFSGNVSIIDMTLPANLKSIGERAFNNCFALTIHYLGDDWSKVSGGEAFADKLDVNKGQKPGDDENDPQTPEKPGDDEKNPQTPEKPGDDEKDPQTPEKSGDDEKDPQTPEKPGDDEKDSQTPEKPVKDDKSELPTVLKAKELTLDKTSVTYNGKEQQPSVTVTDMNNKMIDSKYYTVTYKNNVNVGTATVSVVMKDGYTGTLETSFDIVPKGTKIKKLVAGEKSVKVTLVKQKKQTTGYEIVASTSKNFKKNVKKVTLKNSKTAKKLTKLKAKKKYYVRVRTYKKVNGKKYYSAWSKKKKITTK